MIAGYSFRPRLWAFALALAGCAAGIALGRWQTHRAQEKRAAAEQMQAARRAAPLALPAGQIDAARYVDRRVSASGRFEPRFNVLLDNKIRGERVGYEVVTPLCRPGGSCVLVDRGWVAAAETRQTLPAIRTPSGTVRVEGLAIDHLPRALLAGTPAPKAKVRQNLDIAEFAAETGLALQPLAIEQLSDTGDGLLREWPVPESGAERSAAYAVQWYAFAALAVILFVVLSFRRVAKA